MDTSRDSSVWRSLAVTFGGGLALGAVGMRLTQSALRPADAAPLSEPGTFTDRLSSVERRLDHVERAPAAHPPAASPIDQKVLEAVIGAVEARLHEHAGTMDRRIADLEARLAVEVQTLHRQDEIGLGDMRQLVRQEAETLRAALNQDLRQVADRLSQALSGQASIHKEVEALHQQNERLLDAAEQRFADMREEHRQAMAELRESVAQAHERKFSEVRAALEQSIETRIITAAAAATAAQFDERLAPLRAEVQQKERELAELRRRLADSEGSVVEVISAIGEVCRQAAERMNRSPAAPAAVPPREPEIHMQANPGAEPAALSTAEPLPAAPAPTAETLPVPEPAADPSLARAIPDFLHESDRTATWRIPLVSSLLVTAATGCLFLLHYL